MNGWLDQRARSAANLWLKKNKYKFKVKYLDKMHDEKLDDFIPYRVTAKSTIERNKDDSDTDNTSAHSSLLLQFKMCLPLDSNLLALAVFSKTLCKDALIDYLDSQDEVLQPFVITESLNPTTTIDT